MDYGNLLKRGWSITWNNKWLWVLGFLAALGGNSRGGGGGGGNVGGNFGNPSSGGSTTFDDFNLDPATADQFDQFGRMLENGELWAQIGAIAFVAICCLVLFFFIMWFVRLVAEAGLIQAVADIEDGTKTGFQEAFSNGSQYLGKFFLINLVLWAIPAIVGGIFAAVTAGSIVTAINNDSPEAIAGIFFCIIPLVCLLIPYSFIVTIIYPIAQRGVVLRGMGVMESVRHGWSFFTSHVGEILLLGVIFVAVGIGFGIVSALVSVPIIIAAGAPAFLSFMADGAFPSAGLISIGVAGVIAAIIVASIVNAVMITFRSATFTLAYRELSGGKEAAAAEPADPFDTYE